MYYSLRDEKIKTLLAVLDEVFALAHEDAARCEAGAHGLEEPEPASTGSQADLFAGNKIPANCKERAE